jgi:hypothetical protein
VAAIVWGADTLLLGFILEVPCESKNQSLAIVAAIVGVCMSLYVLRIHRLGKINQNTAYGIAQKIERELSFPHQLNNKIRENYPQGSLAVLRLGAWLFCMLACASFARDRTSDMSRCPTAWDASSDAPYSLHPGWQRFMVSLMNFPDGWV